MPIYGTKPEIIGWRPRPKPKPDPAGLTRPTKSVLRSVYENGRMVSARVEQVPAKPLNDAPPIETAEIRTGQLDCVFDRRSLVCNATYTLALATPAHVEELAALIADGFAVRVPWKRMQLLVEQNIDGMLPSKFSEPFASVLGEPPWWLSI